MRVARHDLMGHLLEVREGERGEHIVLVDGRVVSVKRYGWWMGGSSHFFDLADAEGVTHHIEVQIGAWKFTKTPAVVLIDGVERVALELVGQKRAMRLCAHCGYSMAGLRVENGEVRCPECGRHSSVAALGLKRGAEVVPGQARKIGA